MNSAPSSCAIISNEKLSQIQGSEDPSNAANAEAKSTDSPNNTTKSHKRGFTQKKLQLLCDITGAFRPGVITTLMGVSGAGKTTLMMFLFEEKLVALLKEILQFEGFPRFRRRLLGFWVTDFVKKVLEIIELDKIKDCLVGMPGVTEQRKWLMISVELIANPSIIFMDERTIGLDARAAAIVMQAVKNVAET
ncbi:ABC transporter G family member 37 [Camellia lanceoleosa]|uniref:ABC transporter G family member 37 n=1 Tax=Camellia lanceoleosa TaxID=1840588 RepID=A0ACC0HFE3_9ERIC|nr:ABC transporter G family member 37 [Camellia lanceoleosa]